MVPSEPGPLAEVQSTATWADLDVPPSTLDELRSIVDGARSALGDPGKPVIALFAGESGTGKTVAYEVLARDLDARLYRVDLSRVTSRGSVRPRRAFRKSSTPSVRALPWSCTTRPTPSSESAPRT
jgi:hypothetical protein